MLLKKSIVLDNNSRFVRLEKHELMRCYKCDKWDGTDGLRRYCPVGLCNKLNNPFGSDHNLNFIYVIKEKYLVSGKVIFERFFNKTPGHNPCFGCSKLNYLGQCRLSRDLFNVCCIISDINCHLIYRFYDKKA